MAPNITPESTSITLQARITYAGGLTTVSDPLVIGLVRDTGPFRILNIDPPDKSHPSTVQSVRIELSQPLDPASVTPESIQIVEAGPDGTFDTRDDVPVSGLNLQVLSDGRVVELGYGALHFPDFSSTYGLNLVGAARQADDRLRLTPTNQYSAGAAWFTTPQLVGPGRINGIDYFGGFSTTFSFRISEPSGPGADGFAFVIQGVGPSALGREASGLGYADPALGDAGIPNSVAIEFDTYASVNFGDPSDNHISVQTRGTSPNSADHRFSLGSVTPSIDLNDGKIHTVRIDYQPGFMFIYLDDFNTPILMVNVDLSSVLSLADSRAYVGFTAGTGFLVENHDLLNWSFSSDPALGLPPRPDTFEGRYQIRIDTGRITDRNGRRLGSGRFTSEFTIFEQFS
jgi:hypothetical protein